MRPERIMIVGEIPGGRDAMTKALDLVDEGVEAMPPYLRPDDGTSFHVTVRHDDGCPSSQTRDMEACTCATLIVEAVVLTEEEARALDRSGTVDAIVDDTVDPKSLN